jgi:hypothetical protein
MALKMIYTTNHIQQNDPKSIDHSKGPIPECPISTLLSRALVAVEPGITSYWSTLSSSPPRVINGVLMSYFFAMHPKKRQTNSFRGATRGVG